MQPHPSSRLRRLSTLPSRGRDGWRRLPRLFFLLLDQRFYGGVERFDLGARIALRQRPRRGGASGEKEKQNQDGTAEHGAAAIAQRVRREKGGFSAIPPVIGAKRSAIRPAFP